MSFESHEFTTLTGEKLEGAVSIRGGNSPATLVFLPGYSAIFHDYLGLWVEIYTE